MSIHQPGGGFIDLAAAYGLTDPQGRGRHVAFIDVNHDPYPDLYVGNDYPRADGLPTPNRLFINIGGRAFRSAPEYGLDRNLGANSIQVVDFDRDGWQDLLVSGNTSVRLYRNREGKSFVDVSRDVDVEGFRDFVLVRYKDLLVKYVGPGGGTSRRGPRSTRCSGRADGLRRRQPRRVADLYSVQAGAAPGLVLLGPALTSLPIPQAAFGSGTRSAPSTTIGTATPTSSS